MKRIVRWGIAPLCIVALLIGSFVFQRDTNVANAAWYNSNWDYRVKLTVNGGLASSTTQYVTQTVYLTSGTTWVVPDNWNSSANTVEVIGGGGGGGTGGSQAGGGAGGGAYAKISNLTLTPGASITYQVGSGGAGTTGDGVSGGDTIFNGSGTTCASQSVCAKGGTRGLGANETGQAGGTAASSIGDTKYSGGTGGNGNTGSNGGGGGGAAGPGGAGGNGSSGTGGTGGNGSGGTGGTQGNPGNPGGDGDEWDATHGSGGGGGGTTAGGAAGGDGGNYGGGGAGGRSSSKGGDGGPGIIVIQYSIPSGGAIVLTSGTSWSVPDDWNNASNTIEVIGGGAGGGASDGGTGASGGGGGGAYAKSSNVTLVPGTSVTYAIGAGGGSETAGGDTYFCRRVANCASISGTAVRVGAKGGLTTSVGTGGAGGTTTTSTGTIKYAGGNGGTSDRTWAGGGGGGAAGPHGAGGAGGGATDTAGGGGGGAGGGTAGTSVTGATGGAGGNNYLGSGSGAANTAGTNGGGGGGGSSAAHGGNGGAGTEWESLYGSGGGGGGDGDNAAGSDPGDGALYGGGGGGAAGDTAADVGGSGAQGIILIRYTPVEVEITDFPIYVDMSDLPQHVWSNMRSDCGDIRITTEDLTTEVPREIVECNAGTKTGELHFKAPSVSDTYDTVFYIYYGNGAEADYATNATYGAQNVWTNNYAGVYHLKQDPGVAGASGILDSTSFARHGTDEGTMDSSDDVTGQLGTALDFDGTDDNILISGLMGSTTNATLSAWVDLDAADTSGGDVITLGDHLTLRADAPTDGVLGHYYYTGALYNLTTSADFIAGSSWKYLTYALNDTYNTETIYIDGVASTPTVFTQSILWTGIGRNTYIGEHGNASTAYNFNGRIDEVRVSSSTRSSTWVAIEYYNQYTPSTFYQFGDSDPEITEYLTSGTTWVVPDDWNPLNNSIEVIGGGGGGGRQVSNSGGGGGAGAYSAVNNLSLTPGASVAYVIGAQGTGQTSGSAATAGGDTIFGTSTMANCTTLGSSACVGAKGGSAASGSTGGAGGVSGSGVGTTKYSGGSGGTTSSCSAGGGGGAAGPGGAGQVGAAGGCGGGGGGGGAGGGESTSGIEGNINNEGGAGGAGPLGTGGGAGGPDGVDGSTGTDGGGGGGGGDSGTIDGGVGGVGGQGAEWDSSHGAGGGGGGGGGSNDTAGIGGAGGLYGGGGGGGARDTGAQDADGAVGAQGIIVVSYTPVGSVDTNPSDPYFLTAPYNVSTSSVRMIATSTDQGLSVETENQGPIMEFNFTATACNNADSGTGGSSSGWIATSTYTDTGLQPNKCYSYKVTSRDGLGNTSATSTASSTYTSAITPGALTIYSQTVSGEALEIDHDGGANPTENPVTLFAVVVDVSSPVDANWEDKYIDVNGNPSSTAVWLSDAVLDEITVFGLEPGTAYTFKSKARNGDGDETPFSTGNDGETLNAIPRDVRLRGGATLRGGTTVR